MEKPYRSTNTLDAFDKKYTDIMKTYFEELPSFLKDDFNEMTENLMQDEIVSNWKLMDAIKDFYKEKKTQCDEIHQWKRFDDISYNCRPWQA